MVSRCQKAPSAIRCIKTVENTIPDDALRVCQKAPSAIRCIKTAHKLNLKTVITHKSEST